jgi:signal transduction histidine kinase
LLDPACETAGTLDREARHHLRTPLNHILGYCELWIEDAEAQLLDGFVGDLRKVHGLARGLLGRLDESARLVKAASDHDIDLNAAGLPEMIRDVVGSAPALTGAGRRHLLTAVRQHSSARNERRPARRVDLRRTPDLHRKG